MKQSCLLHVFIKIKSKYENKTKNLAEEWKKSEGATERDEKRERESDGRGSSLCVCIYPFMYLTVRICMK